MADAPLNGPPIVVSAAAGAAADDVRRELESAITEARAPDLARMRRRFDDFHRGVLGAAENPRPTCARGCSRCCEQLVHDVSAHEIEELGWWLRATGRAEEVRAALLERVALYDDVGREHPRIPGESGDAHAERVALAFWTRRSPCALLDDEGACTVHERRPFACRRFFVLGSADLCRAETAGAEERGAFVLEPFEDFDELMDRAEVTAPFDPGTDRMDLALLRWLENRTETSI